MVPPSSFHYSHLFALDFLSYLSVPSLPPPFPPPFPPINPPFSPSLPLTALTVLTTTPSSPSTAASSTPVPAASIPANAKPSPIPSAPNPLRSSNLLLWRIWRNLLRQWDRICDGGEAEAEALASTGKDCGSGGGRAGGDSSPPTTDKSKFKEIDALPWMNYLSFDIIGDLAFGAPFGMLPSGADIATVTPLLHHHRHPLTHHHPLHHRPRDPGPEPSRRSQRHAGMYTLAETLRSLAPRWVFPERGSGGGGFGGDCEGEGWG